MAGSYKIDDTIWRRIMRFAASRTPEAQESHVKVGVIASQGGSAQHSDSGLSVLEIAAVHEFGAPSVGIPERSFIRRTFANKSAEMAKICGQLAAQFLAGLPLEKALGKLGLWGQNAVKQTITKDGVPPPLKPATIKRKGSSRPLVDTGQLLNSITFKVWMGRIRDAQGRFVSGGRFDL